jgi:hypothetical protein
MTDPVSADEAVANLFSGQFALGARAGVSSVADRNPDAEAEIQRNARRLGVPYESARANSAEINRRIAAQNVDYDNLARVAPRTTRFLGEASHAAIAHDDIGVLGKIEQHITGFFGAIAKSIDRIALDEEPAGKKVARYTKGVGDDITPDNIGRATVQGAGGIIQGLLGASEAGSEIGEKIDVTASLQRRVLGFSLDEGFSGMSRQWRHRVDRAVWAATPKRTS